MLNFYLMLMSNKQWEDQCLDKISVYNKQQKKFLTEVTRLQTLKKECITASNVKIFAIPNVHVYEKCRIVEVSQKITLI